MTLKQEDNMDEAVHAIADCLADISTCNREFENDYNKTFLRCTYVKTSYYNS